MFPGKPIKFTSWNLKYYCKLWIERNKYYCESMIQNLGNRSRKYETVLLPSASHFHNLSL